MFFFPAEITALKLQMKTRPLFRTQREVSERVFFGDHHRQHSPPAAEIRGFLLPGHGACITRADPSLR